MPGSQNRKYYIIWNTRLLHSFGLSREHYKYLVFPRNLLPLPAVVSFSFLLPIVNPLLAFSTVTYSTTDILRSCTTMPRERLLGVMKKGSFCNALAAEQEAESFHSVEIQQENTGSYKFQGML